MQSFLLLFLTLRPPWVAALTRPCHETFDVSVGVSGHPITITLWHTGPQHTQASLGACWVPWHEDEAQIYFCARTCIIATSSRLGRPFRPSSYVS
jgi:hypothetical protein